MITEYRNHEKERAKQGIPPKPLNSNQVKYITKALTDSDTSENVFFLDLLTHRVPPGVDPAASAKTDFLRAIAYGEKQVSGLDKKKAVALLGTMLGGYNVLSLIDLLDIAELAHFAAQALSQTLLIFDSFSEIFEKSKTNPYAKQVIDSWAAGEWFTNKPELPKKITLTAFKIDGEINTDDLSPAGEAWSRPDIPLHATTLLKNRITAPLEIINKLKVNGNSIVFVGDVVGTGSSRKSATNSVLWHIGQDIPFVPNKRRGGIVLGGKIAPIFFNTLEDAGALPIECDVSQIQNGNIIEIYPYDGKIINTETGKKVSQFNLKTEVLLDEIQAGGRIPLIIGRSLTEKARSALGLSTSTVFRKPFTPENAGKGFTLAQKIVGRACGTDGIRPGTYCEPKIATVGSQDTTGPMTRDELTELACLSFSADLVMQSFCHTAAYPKTVDLEMHRTMPTFFSDRGGIVLKPGDGVIHSWLNRMILPDTVGTGGDSHTRFPIGISFPAGSGLVAFAAAMGIMPLDMPKSVLVQFSGKIQPGITLRDLVNFIPFTAIQNKGLTVEKEGKKNLFSGHILEIEGLENLSVDQAFELTNASAERSASACTIRLQPEPVIRYLKTNVTLLEQMIKDGYGHKESILRRVTAMKKWLENPVLLSRDQHADFSETLQIDLDSLKEPILACPNDPDDVRLLSTVAGKKIDDVFIGSCMTNIGHFRAVGQLLKGKTDLPTRLWIAPPTQMDRNQLQKEGILEVFEKAGARIEIPGCSLCMGNQARIPDYSTAFSTSTRNFPNRMGDNTNVFLGSAELGAVCAISGKIPTHENYLEQIKCL